jgi:hypothetical protein
LLEDGGVTLSSGIIGIVLLIVMVTTEGSVESVGDCVLTVVRAQVIDAVGSGLVEVAMAVRSNITL